MIFENEGIKSWQCVGTEPSKEQADVRDVQNGEINNDTRWFKYDPIMGRCT